MLVSAGLEDMRIAVGARKSGDPFVVLVACGSEAEKNRDVRGSSTP